MFKKRLMVTVLLVMAMLILPVRAQDGAEDFYAQQYERSGAGELSDVVPDRAKEYLDENNIDPENEDWVSAFSAENVFSHMLRFLKDGLRTVWKTAAGLLGIILISAAIGSLEQKNNAVKAAIYAASVVSASAVTASVISVITASVDALKGVGVFMLSFVPVFGVTVAASGAPITSASMSAVLLAAAQGVTFFATFLVAPLMSGYLAVSLSGAISSVIKQSGIAETVKKLAFWIMGLLSAVFVAVLGIQTAVNSSADTVSIKTAKFILGSTVPVAGSVLSEALTTVTASMGLLRSSVGIYGVVVCLLTFLPLLLEILLWRAALTISAGLSDLFSLSQLSGMFKAFDAVLSMLAGILLLVGAMFIICLAVVVTAGRSS